MSCGWSREPGGFSWSSPPACYLGWGKWRWDTTGCNSGCLQPLEWRQAERVDPMNKRKKIVSWILMNFYTAILRADCGVFTCSMIWRIVLSLTTPDGFSEPASLGSVSVTRKTCTDQKPHPHTTIFAEIFCKVVNGLLATINSSGRSLASFSLAASEMGPNITTGRLNPAGGETKKKVLVHKHT